MKTVFIGDPMIKEIDVNKLSRKSVHKICMPGAKIEEIKNSLELALQKESFDQVIIHAGTNNLSNTRTNQIATGVFDLAKTAITTNPDIRVSTSSLIATRQRMALYR